MRTVLVLCLSATRAASSAALAQDMEYLAPGTEIRVSAPSVAPEGRLVGPIIAMTTDTILLRVESPASWRSQEVRIPLASLAELEVRRPGHRLPGLKGFAIGAVVGAAVNLATCPSRYSGEDTDYCRAFGTPFLAGVGGVLGAVVGAIAWGPHWEDVSPKRLRVGIVPVRTGFAVGASITL